MLAPMAAVSYQEIKAQLRELYVQDERPWLVRPAAAGGGKDSTKVASLVFDAVLSVPPGQRKQPVAILCTDTLPCRRFFRFASQSRGNQKCCRLEL